MPRPVGGRAGPLRRLLAVVDGLAAERTLVYSSVIVTREGHAVLLQFQHCRHGLAAHILDRVLVPEPVGALDRVVHVETPVVSVAHIAERRRHAALGRNRVAAGRKDLGDAGRPKTGCRHTQGCPKPGAAGTDNDNIVGMLDDGISLCHCCAPLTRPLLHEGWPGLQTELVVYSTCPSRAENGRLRRSVRRDRDDGAPCFGRKPGASVAAMAPLEP